MSQKVLLTGLTSFTGYCISAQLAPYYEIIAPLYSKNYEDIKAERIKLAGNIKTIQPLNICSDEFIQKIDELKPQIFINHASFVNNYRSDDFDVLHHLETNLKYIKPLIYTLKKNNCQVFIHSGSAFEPNEGYSQYGVSVYGVAKKMAWDLTAFWCVKLGLPLIKIIIPNPYGHLENEDRLLPIFYQKIKQKEKVELRDCLAVRNNIRGENLAKYYAQACKLAGTQTPNNPLIIKPIGHIETQEQFVFRALQEEPYNLSSEEIQEYIKPLAKQIILE